MEKIQAAGKFIILDKSNIPEKRPSGLEFTEDDLSKQRAQRAKVISFGHEVLGLSVGDDVYYDKARSFDQIINGEERIMAKEADILVIIHQNIS